ncbi:four helix bundle protein [Capnocytophaga sp.]|uniref:four helix bundle protein n=1 Tax=Capnocytophaga sp. TaxID=44737 RepID=UPI0026DD785D|nr:four helix bundle protein [Capnocytophaga sp.]MDO5106462.1 four helix bundle protein [Capnocytophaga sp.]
MPTVTYFEDLEIWKISRILCSEIYRISSRESFEKDYRFKNQMRAAAGSVMDNIAEGFERQGNSEFKQFLYIAKGSAGEVRSQLYRAFDNSYISEEEFNDLRQKYQSLSIKIKNFITYLQNSAVKGSKHM